MVNISGREGKGGSGADRKRGTAENVFDSHLAGTGISSFASSFFLLFFSDSSPTKSRTLVFFSHTRTHTHGRTFPLFLLIRVLLARSHFHDSSLFRRLFAGRLCRSKRAWLFRQRMFNRSIVSVGRAADFPLGSTPLLKFGGGEILLLLSRRLLPLGSSHIPFIFSLLLLHLHIFTFIRLFAGGWYLITATDLPISATFSETHNAPLLGDWAAASPGHRRQEGKGWMRMRRHQEQARIFFASFAQPLLSIRSPSTSFLPFVLVVVTDSTEKVDITAPPFPNTSLPPLPPYLPTEFKVTLYSFVPWFIRYNFIRRIAPQPLRWFIG